MLKQLLLLAVGVLISARAYEFELRARRSPPIFAEAPKLYNTTYSGQQYKFELSKTQKLQLTPKIELDHGFMYVFSKKTCTSGCKKTDPAVLYDVDNAGEGKPVDGGSFTYKLNEKDSFSGTAYTDNAKFGDNLPIPLQFGVVTSGGKDYDAPDDVVVGLGFDVQKQTKIIPLFTKLSGDGVADKKAILIRNGDKQGEGRIIFGADNDTSCLNLFLTDAKKSDGQPGWGFTIDHIINVGAQGEEKTKTAVLDFTTDQISLPKSLSGPIGTDAVTDKCSLPEIKITIAGKDIVLRPEHYTVKDKDGKWKPLVVENTQKQPNDPDIRLGSTFYKNRCIVLNGETSGKNQIGFSLWEETKKECGNGVGQIQLSLATLLGAASMLMAARLF